MTEFAQWAVGVALLAAVATFAYMLGRDAAERQAAETIAHLRKHNRRLRAETYRGNLHD